jgi:hypothetical protein
VFLFVVAKSVVVATDVTLKRNSFIEVKASFVITHAGLKREDWYVSYT